MCFQLVDNQVLSTRGQADVNLHRLTIAEVVRGELTDVGVAALLPGTERALEIRIPVPVTHRGRLFATPVPALAPSVM